MPCMPFLLDDWIVPFCDYFEEIWLARIYACACTNKHESWHSKLKETKEIIEFLNGARRSSGPLSLTGGDHFNSVPQQVYQWAMFMFTKLCLVNVQDTLVWKGSRKCEILMSLLEPHLILGLVPIILTIVILVAILTLATKVTRVTKVKIGGSLGCPSMEVRFLKPTC